MKKKILHRLKIFLAFILTASLLIILYGLYKIYHLPPGNLGDQFPTRIYAAPFFLSPGDPVSLNLLERRLKRLGYKPREESPTIAGEYYRKNQAIEIFLRGFSQPFWDAPQQKVELSLDGDGILTSTVSIHLEPELVADLSGEKKIQREPATFAEIPPYLIQALIAIEDRRFYEHHGIDPRALLRATWTNFKSGKLREGGSTLTQQLVKNLFLVPKKTLWRKAAETILALYLETRYSKQEILTLYFNQAYWGQNGPVSIAGIKAATRFYFNKPLTELTVAESALLVGLLRSPLKYSPFRDVSSALARRNFVLNSMLRQGILRPPDYQKTIREPLSLNLFPTRTNPGKADYFLSDLMQQLVEHYTDAVVFRHGLKVFTTLDPLIQESAQMEISRLPNQGALINLDPFSGAIRAMVGGKNFSQSQFNRATQAKRQPGSAFKPFVYGAALRRRDREGHRFTLASLILDEPREYKIQQGSWTPKNFYGVYSGTVTVRQALSRSLNAATVNLAFLVGPKFIANYAHSLGIESPLQEDLGIALGTSEVTLLELTAAYAPFVNKGKKIKPYLIEGIQDLQGEVLERHEPNTTQVLQPGESYLVTSLLESVVKEGTAKSLKTLGFTYPAAGKTGTTNKEQDAWFVGYTPRTLMGVWVGEDKPRSIGATGATAALPVWARVINTVLEGFPSEEFSMPEDVQTAKVDPTTGFLAVSGCPQKVKESFLIGTEPDTHCTLHPGGLKGWFQKLFGTSQSTGSLTLPHPTTSTFH
ncbi:MAG: PBP1A family penicillin-binding protein [Elusimicrobia bacterium]|nr:PBP1A family penicillin-binding protein [Elusimicrobiota bacterium]